MNAIRFSLALGLVVAALAAPRSLRAQNEAELPDIDTLREWLVAHHPHVVDGDSTENAALIVVDTGARYVKSIAFHLTANEVAEWSRAAVRGVLIQDDAALRDLRDGCFDDPAHPKSGPLPLCLLDGARVPSIDGLRFLASREVVVLKGDTASKRFGADGAHGAVIAKTDSAMLARYRSVGATPATFVAFEERRIRRRTDGAPVVITVLMLRSGSKQ